MASWVQCPWCLLKHTEREDGLCPRCRRPIALGSGQGLSPSTPPPPPERTTPTPPPGSPAREAVPPPPAPPSAGWGPPGTPGATPPAAPAEFGFCSRCGARAEGAFCTACGAPVGVQPRKGLSAAWPIAGITVAALLGATCIGAIVVPGFVRSGRRARQAGVQAELRALVNAQVAHNGAGKGVIPFDAIPSGAPGPEQRPLSPEDLAVARALGWSIGPSTYAQYRVAARKDAAGNVALAFCAETDLDGDGKTSAIVAFLPTIDAGGAVVQEPPEPPCSASAQIGPGGNLYRPAWQGKLMPVSPRDVF